MKILYRLVQGRVSLATKDGATRKLKRWNPEEIPNRCQTCGGFGGWLPMHVIDRQLLQRHFLGFAQFYDTLHPLPGTTKVPAGLRNSIGFTKNTILHAVQFVKSFVLMEHIHTMDKLGSCVSRASI
ncbi:hypothetical protein [Paraburkholderia sp. 40]|uniref:hypothetical protein n=1 Tax=Paraburkholderia sp. 40 TaxID=2991059 RepID=UPI003D1B8D03